ncbi:antiviral reverse transcriptase Drt4 [Thiohalophilus thiocyanatoxydans]|uniref:Reverse transcriptase (RNA-dependent DNA polymerase) n=1 Tax=Thiohalophilus thiocyanatoxydans TaxID=381308 RepID=A0A4R8IY51_9GAMM|nr:antiviral reverse transcriptase Drt4 [Thiohalophilus thiocyanatoxydans]TDY02857.1 reverse transcriptase (RNA-dependent DNA polymerase) [Thiohalophilus thiocyanatoxydans]
MSVDSDYMYEALTRWNYFPNQKSKSEELPSIFSTRQFTPHVAKRLVAEALRQGGYDQIEYYATRYNNVSRPLAIPHPMPYAHLVNCICDNWNELKYICDNENSLIKPEVHADMRALVMDYEEPLEKTNRSLTIGFGKKFRAHTDISNCFPSIYTHAIPWATVGFSYAKSHAPHKNPAHKALWFNRLDYHQRMIKRNETQGVAIGPGTSNVVSEAILAKIDENLSSKYTYYRYIDDFTCYCEEYEESQDFFRDLNDELRKYKLTLNLKKTEIVELPAPIDSDWVVELSTRMPAGTPNDPPKTGKHYGASEALRYIDFAVQLKKKTPDGSVLKFAVKNIIYRLDEYAVQPVFEYLLNISRFYPLLLPLLNHLVELKKIDCTPYARNLNEILIENAINRRSDGMCWALYYLVENDLVICYDAVEKVLETRDCMAILMLYQVGVFEGETKQFVDNLDSSDLYELDQYWVLLYQLFFDGIIANPFVGENCFDILKDEDVSFIPISGHHTKSEIDLIGKMFVNLDEEAEVKGD